tara:strand:- start:16887 stop:17915 length:1029 start_codon:yes stop_codon:yes gene_type:complete
MAINSYFNNSVGKEVLFQIFLHSVVFLFFTFDKYEPEIQGFKVVCFLNYATGAFVINYILLPRFFYRKKYLFFFCHVAIIVSVNIAFEELVLERIFYPDTRAMHFPGVVYSLLDVLPVILILVGFKFAWDASKKQLEVEELRSLVKESELLFLKSQINPHFLFNNLNNLYSYAIEKSPKTPSIILELSSVLRYMLYDCKEKFVAIHKEMEHLRNFTRLNEMQIEERGEVIFKTPQIKDGYQIAPLILSVFIENAFKHSTASQSENIFIHVNISLDEEGILNFECRNSFLEVTNTASLSNGIGLRNVKKRLELLYPNAHDLYIRNEQNIYYVHLKLKIEKVKA